MEIYSIQYEGVRYTLTEERGYNGRNMYTIRANGRQIERFEADNQNVALARFDSVTRAYF